MQTDRQLEPGTLWQQWLQQALKAAGLRLAGNHQGELLISCKATADALGHGAARDTPSQDLKLVNIKRVSWQKQSCWKLPDAGCS
jgi:hypothetical protein